MQEGHSAANASHVSGDHFPLGRNACQALLDGRHSDPFAVLGPHAGQDGRRWLTIFRPDAERAEIIDASGAVLAALAPLSETFAPADGCAPSWRQGGTGLFAAPMPAEATSAYRIRYHHGAAHWEQDDPYRFPSRLGPVDMHLWAEGRHWRADERLGAHPCAIQGVAGTAFAVWAPNARRVSVVGDFNGWDGRTHVMRLHPGAGIWEIFIPGLGEGTLYKYEMLGSDGGLLPLKADPFAFRGQLRPDTASVVARLDRHVWQDAAWMAQRAARNARNAPISIYEAHLGSWRRADDGGYLSYRTLADRLIPYVKEMGFTHLEVMPVHEHPFDGSWGYQALGLFAPTSRHGGPEDFQYFVDACHQAGLGLIIDWVPGHFPMDAHGLYRFDGTPLYEHADPREGYHPDWNTAIYNFGRREVSNMLINNALFWLRHYRVDGLRVDAVASMLYRDYSRKEGEWMPNAHGGRENLEAIAFLRALNILVYGTEEGQGGGAVTIAEESTAWPGVSRPVDAGGLGFGYKWNMGWMHDTLRYMQRDPIHRRHHHHDLTFGLLYAFSENFILPLSHDEVVHGKGSLLDRMPGDPWQKFANLRAYYGFMWGHPGKKLLFMGGEFAQGREWDHDNALDWGALEQDGPGGGWHRGVQALVRDLNALYQRVPALHACDCEARGFAWIKSDAAEESLLTFSRHGDAAGDIAVIIAAFTPVPRYGFRIGLPKGGIWREAINTDAACYGGANIGNHGQIEAEPMPWDGQPFSAVLTVPPLATLILIPD
jgi:1,4-alpha-glucan branching enzyme